MLNRDNRGNTLRWVAVLLLLWFTGWVTVTADSGEYNYFVGLATQYEYGDKVGHLLLYGLFTLLLNAATHYKKLRVGRFRCEIGALVVLIFTVSEEISQLYFPARNFEWLDLAADFTGVFLATWLARRLNQRRRQKTGRPKKLVVAAVTEDENPLV